MIFFKKTLNFGDIICLKTWMKLKKIKSLMIN